MAGHKSKTHSLTHENAHKKKTLYKTNRQPDKLTIDQGGVEELQGKITTLLKLALTHSAPKHKFALIL